MEVPSKPDERYLHLWYEDEKVRKCALTIAIVVAPSVSKFPVYAFGVSALSLDEGASDRKDGNRRALRRAHAMARNIRGAETNGAIYESAWVPKAKNNRQLLVAGCAGNAEHLASDIFNVCLDLLKFDIKGPDIAAYLKKRVPQVVSALSRSVGAK